jgi:hypothetical protein
VDYSDILLTMAELAVALAGFASLESVIGRRGDDRSWVQVSTIGLASVSVVVNLANILGLGGSHAASLYVGALVLGLGKRGPAVPLGGSLCLSRARDLSCA